MAKGKLPRILANHEDHFTLKALARMIHSGIHVRTLERWMTTGKRQRRSDPASPIIKMDFIRGPSGRRSSVEAYHRFVAAFNGVD